MLMQTWPAYEHYTGLLGAQTFTDIPAATTVPTLNPASTTAGASGTAPIIGIGMDWTVATGTGFVGQYPPRWPRCTSRRPPAR